jgi:hypothetical protein
MKDRGHPKTFESGGADHIGGTHPYYYRKFYIPQESTRIFCRVHIPRTRKRIILELMSIMKWGIEHKVFDEDILEFVVVCTIVEAISMDDALKLADDKELRNPIIVGRLVSEIDKDGNITDYDKIMNT